MNNEIAEAALANQGWQKESGPVMNRLNKASLNEMSEIVMSENRTGATARRPVCSLGQAV